MKTVENTNYGKVLKKLGYSLKMWSKAPDGRIRKYATYPIDGSGPINHFDSLSQVRKYAADVALVRSMQELDDIEWQERMYSRYVASGGRDYK